MTSEPSSASFKPADFSPSQAGALALNAVFFDSPRRAADYHALFGSLSDLQDAWGLVESQLPDRLRPVAAARWKAFSLVDLKQKLSQSDIEPVFKTDSDYPSGLAELADAPPVVYIRGDRSVLGREGIAIVGSREMTEYGRQVTHQFTLDLAPYFTIISGLAKGVDGVAHRAAIQAGGTTIA
ncbi:hypothetical protein EBR96_06900, partial [bacterium]|nr:hypothetical protein [bacterium]